VLHFGVIKVHPCLRLTFTPSVARFIAPQALIDHRALRCHPVWIPFLNASLRYAPHHPHAPRTSHHPTLGGHPAGAGATSAQGADHDRRQWHGILIPSGYCCRARGRFLLCQALPLLGTRPQRAHQWPRQTVLSQENQFPYDHFSAADRGSAQHPPTQSFRISHPKRGLLTRFTAFSPTPLHWGVEWAGSCKIKVILWFFIDVCLVLWWNRSIVI
jgi:hypothetical protein